MKGFIYRIKKDLFQCNTGDWYSVFFYDCDWSVKKISSNSVKGLKKIISYLSFKYTVYSIFSGWLWRNAK